MLDQDRTPASRQLIDAYRVADYFVIADYVASEAEMRTMIDNNEARAAIIIPPGYGRRLSGWQPGQVAFVLDGSDPTMASTALAAATLIGQAQSTRLAVERLAARGQPTTMQQAIDVRTMVWFNPGLISAYYMVPAMIGIILQYLSRRNA